MADEIGAYLSSVEDRARAAEIHAAEAKVRARSILVLSAVAILVLALGGGGYYWLETEAEGLVAVAMQKASARLGEASASGFEDLASWTKARDAADEAQRLAASEFVRGELQASVAEVVESSLGMPDLSGQTFEGFREAVGDNGLSVATLAYQPEVMPGGTGHEATLILLDLPASQPVHGERRQGHVTTAALRLRVPEPKLANIRAFQAACDPHPAPR